MADFTIGQIADEFGVTLRTIRFYEHRGLVRPTRTAGGGRLYSELDRKRMREIMLMRQVGFTVAEIARGGFDKAKFREQLELLQRQRAELDDSILLLDNLIFDD